MGHLAYADIVANCARVAKHRANRLGCVECAPPAHADDQITRLIARECNALRNRGHSGIAVDFGEGAPLDIRDPRRVQNTVYKTGGFDA